MPSQLPPLRTLVGLTTLLVGLTTITLCVIYPFHYSKADVDVVVTRLIRATERRPCEQPGADQTAAPEDFSKINYSISWIRYNYFMHDLLPFTMRNPRPPYRYSGPNLKRYADRQNLATLFQPPPRNPRTELTTRLVGLETITLCMIYCPTKIVLLFFCFC